MIMRRLYIRNNGLQDRNIGHQKVSTLLTDVSVLKTDVFDVKTYQAKFMGFKIEVIPKPMTPEQIEVEKEKEKH
ncbi:hypothetical protein COLO4_21103 [Corchorus olitorius]|uniref:Uncharacterized protein n=1 Tax=Corchorus olitorius TaxID=93759 RepID=A0A1R3IVB0_9ROSI|nr:hypothetical protein COLO4_21103 [Corchorus olitorius]